MCNRVADLIVAAERQDRMNNDIITEKNIRRFFRDPFSNEYSRYFSETVIATVAQMNAVMEYAADMIPPSRRKGMEEIMGAAAKQTLQLMRVAAVSRTLSDTKPAKELIEVDALIGFLCEQFERKLGERIKFRLRSVSHAMVLSDRRIITELILGAVRKMALRTSADEPEFFIGADVVGRNVRIYIVDRNDEDTVYDAEKDTPPAGEEFFDRFFSEANSIIAELIGAAGGYGNGLYTLELPRLMPEDDTNTELRSPVVYDTSGCGFTCDIMLDDDKLTAKNDSFQQQKTF